MKLEKDKIKCEECGWVGKSSKSLKAFSPFDGSEITACPECKFIQVFCAVCDEPGCKKLVSCGTPTKDGYRSTCHEHTPY